MSRNLSIPIPLTVALLAACLLLPGLAGAKPAAMPAAGAPAEPWEGPPFAADAAAVARAAARVEYRQALAERSGLDDGAVDVVTVATALHWFDFDRFYAEVERVLAPGGALVAWAYNLARVTPELDVLIDRLARQVVGAYWPPERRWVDEEYRTLPFPFDEVAVPELWIEEPWDFDRFIPYFGTWSATVRYRQATGHDPLELVGEEMARAWGDPAQVRTVRWPLMMRAGRPRHPRR